MRHSSNRHREVVQIFDQQRLQQFGNGAADRAPFAVQFMVIGTSSFQSGEFVNVKIALLNHV
jgi:hypothetical protein